MEKLYHTSTIIGRLYKYFLPYLYLLTKPSRHKMLLLLLAMITMQFTTSINHLFKWFLSVMDNNTSLNAYYYLLAKTMIPLDKFMQITIRLALSLIPNELKKLPIFLTIDDTLQPKYGTHFECYSTMFDHTKRNGSNYLKGHCFVSMVIGFPVMTSGTDTSTSAGTGTGTGTIQYLHVPIGYRLRDDESKLAIASAMIELAMEVIPADTMTILLCDSWYPKGDVVTTVKKYENLELIANVRVDTCIFDLPPKRTGKRGRPAKKGQRLDIYSDHDFNFVRVGDYFIAVRTVLTNLFGDLPIYLTVTTPNLKNHKSYRVFISTILPKHLKTQFDDHHRNLSHSLNGQILWLLPLFLYSFRWSIEVMFYEQKTFWSFGLYRLRSKEGIVNFVNFSSLCYACMKILPHMDARFSSLIFESPQTCKSLFGEAIRAELFLYRFLSKSENGLYSSLDLHSFHDLGWFLFFNSA